MIHASDINSCAKVNADGTLTVFGDFSTLLGAIFVQYAKNIHFSTVHSSLKEIRSQLDFSNLPDVTALISDFSLDGATACAVLLAKADENETVAEKMFGVANPNVKRNIRTFVAHRSGIASNTATVFPKGANEEDDALRKAVREFISDNSPVVFDTETD